MQIKVDLKIFLFLLIFLLTKKIEVYGILMIFSLLHEIGHFLCGLTLGFKPQKMTILPYGLKINFKTNLNDLNIKIKKGNILSVKKIILALAGPVTNFICIAVTIFMNKHINEINNSIYTNIIYANMLIALFNLLPIFPLDGGRIVNEFIHIKVGLRKSYRYTQVISEMTLYIITTISSILILYYKNIAIFIIIVYLDYAIIILYFLPICKLNFFHFFYEC